MPTYSEVLKHPKWQRKRLEILNRDNFTCRCCGDKNSTLHVHHFMYLTGHMPWEYPDDNFITMCETCHTEEEDFIKGHNKAFIKLNRMFNVPIRKMWHSSFILCFLMAEHPDLWEEIKAKMNDAVDDKIEGFVKRWEKYHE